VFLTGFPGDWRIQLCINWTAVILTNFWLSKTVFSFSSFKVFYKGCPEDGVDPHRNMSRIIWNLKYCDFLVYESVQIIHTNFMSLFNCKLKFLDNGVICYILLMCFTTLSIVTDHKDTTFRKLSVFFFRCTKNLPYSNNLQKLKPTNSFYEY
jgi:hypothetical protein